MFAYRTEIVQTAAGILSHCLILNSDGNSVKFRALHIGFITSGCKFFWLIDQPLFEIIKSSLQYGLVKELFEMI